MKNVKKVLKEFDLDLEDLVKVVVYLKVKF